MQEDIRQSWAVVCPTNQYLWPGSVVVVPGCPFFNAIAKVPSGTGESQTCPSVCVRYSSFVPSCLQPPALQPPRNLNVIAIGRVGATCRSRTATCRATCRSRLATCRARGEVRLVAWAATRRTSPRARQVANLERQVARQVAVLERQVAPARPIAITFRFLGGCKAGGCKQD